MALKTPEEASKTLGASRRLAARCSADGRLWRLTAEPSTWLGLAVLVLPLGSAQGPTSISVTPSDLFLVVAACCAGLSLLRGRRPEPVRSVPAAALLVAVSLTIVAALVAPDFPESLVGALRFVELFLLTPLAVLVGLRTRRDAAVVLGSVVALAFVEGAVGVVQTLTRTGASIGGEYSGEYIRAVGTFGAYNIAALAQLCSLALVLCLAWGVVRQGRERVVAIALSALLAVPLMLSLSRGVWVATALACVVVLSRGRPMRLLAAVGGLSATAALVVPILLRSDTDLGRRLASLLSVASNPDQSFTDRLQLWSAALQMAFDHPLTGVGPRAFVEHRDGYSGVALQAASDFAIGADFQRVAIESPHNFYLLLASEQGLLVAFVYATVLALLLVRGLARTARRRADISTAVALTGVGMIAVQMISMLTSDLGGPGSLLIALSVGLAAWAAADVNLTVPAAAEGPRLGNPAAVEEDRP